MKKVIFCTSDKAYIDTFNVFVNTWIHDKPKDVDLILFHTDHINQQDVHPDVILRPVPNHHIICGIEGSRYYAEETALLAARLLVLDEIKYEYDWIAYFDTDTVIHDIDAVLSVTPSHTLAAVGCEFTEESHAIIDKYYDFELQKGNPSEFAHLMNPDYYFNSGVLFFDAIKLRNKPAMAPLFSLCGDKLHFPDQDFLNVFFKDDVEWLPSKFNAAPLPPIFTDDARVVVYIEPHAQYHKNYLSNAVVIHYVSHSKPWRTQLTDYKSHRDHYIAQTDYTAWFAAYEKTQVSSEFKAKVDVFKQYVDEFNN